MKRLTRREFHCLAAVGAIAGAAATTPLAQVPAHSVAALQSQVTEPKAPAKVLLTPEQEKKVHEKIAEREQEIAILRSRVLPYDLEPAFVFHVRAVARRPRMKG